MIFIRYFKRFVSKSIYLFWVFLVQSHTRIKNLSSFQFSFTSFLVFGGRLLQRRVFLYSPSPLRKTGSFDCLSQERRRKRRELFQSVRFVHSTSAATTDRGATKKGSELKMSEGDTSSNEKETVNNERRRLLSPESDDDTPKQSFAVNYTEIRKRRVS